MVIHVLKLKTYSTYLFLLMMAVVLNSCADTYNNPPAEAAVQQKDSITVWIAQAKDTISPIREAFLDKAYTAVLKLPKDTIKAKHLVDLSYEYSKTTDTSAFRKINKEAILLTTRLEDSSRLATAYWDLGDYYSYRLYKKDSGYYYYSKAQQLYENIKDSFSSALMLRNMAYNEIDIKDYMSSEIHTIKAIQLLEPLGKYRQLYNCYNNLGIVFDGLENYDKAIDYYNQALAYLKKTDRRNTLESIALNNIGVAYKNQGKYAKAIEKYKEAERKNDMYAKDPEFKAAIIDNMAYAKFKMGDMAELPEMFFEALKIRDEENIVPGIVINKLHLAEYYTYYKDTVNALKYADEARELAVSSKNFEDLQASLQLLSKLEKGKKSITHLNRYITISDSLQKEERNLREKFTRLRFETDELILRNEQIEQLSQLQKWIIGVSLTALGFFTLAYIIFMQQNTNKRLKTEAEINMLKLSEKITMGKVLQKERQRISRELHDGILGQLFGTRMTLDSFNAKADKISMEKRSECIDKLQRIEKEIRIVSHELNKDAFTDTNYVELVRALLEERSEIDKYEYMFDNDDAIVWKPVSDKIKLNLYRILQEALQNIHKHAGAENVLVSYTKEKGNLLMCISDDGAGFDMAGNKKPIGIGMKNMRSRVSSLKGKIAIDAVVKQGTTIDISVPLKYNKPKKKFLVLKWFNKLLKIKTPEKEETAKTEEGAEQNPELRETA